MSAPQPILEHSSHVYTLDGRPLVSVTRVIDALIKKSFDGVSPETLKNAADRGLLVEQYATELMRNGFVNTVSERDDVNDRMDCFERWWFNAKPKLLVAQKMVFSEIDGTAGTLDWVLTIGAKTYIVDCKCTAQPERTWILQLGAYYTMLPAPEIDRVAILHINPKYSDGYIWREYDPELAAMHWQRGLAWYNSLQILKAEAAE